MGGPGGGAPAIVRPAGRAVRAAMFGLKGGAGGRGGYFSTSLPPLFSFSIPLPLLTPLLFTEEQYHIIQSLYDVVRKLKEGRGRENTIWNTDLPNE